MHSLGTLNTCIVLYCKTCTHTKTQKTAVTYFARTVKMGVIKIFTYLSAKLYARFNLQNKMHSLNK